MMAFDRTPSAPTLEPETVDALRTALARSVGQRKHDDDLRDTLNRAAKEARVKGMQPERLLVLLKEIWYSVPAVSTAASHETEQSLLQELITRCIQQYYGS